MTINSNLKGKRGELLFAKFLKHLGFKARRGQQYSGSPDSPDVVHDVPGVHFEVKFTERLLLGAAMRQAHQDAGKDEIPVVAYKRKRRGWVAILDMEDFLNLIAKK